MIQAEHFARRPFISFEIPIVDQGFDGTWPPSMVTPRGTVGMLIGRSHPDRPDRLAPPYEALRYGNIRLITAAERAVGGRHARPSAGRPPR